MLLSLALLLCAPALADQPAAEAALTQQALPTLDARRQAAQARARAAQGWFTGKLPFAGAFPDLVGAPLDAPDWLRAQASRLQAAAADRAAQRVAPPPADLGRTALRRWQTARDAALDAEDAADTLRFRLFAALLAGLERAPGLADPAVRQQADTLADRRRAVDPDDPDEAARWGQAEAALTGMRTAARRAMSIPGDDQLDTLARTDASALAALPEGAEDYGLTDRLGRVLPLLPDDHPAHAIHAARIRAELQRQLAEASQPPAPPPADATPAMLQALRAQAQADLDQANETLNALGAQGIPSDTDPPNEAWLRLQLAGAQQARDRARIEALDAARARAPSAISDEEVDAARARAEAARRAVAEADNQSDAHLRAQIAQVRAQAADIKAATRADESDPTLPQLRDRLDQAEQAARVARALPPLDPQREPALDQGYKDVRDLTAQVRSAVEALSAKRRDVLHDHTRIRAGLPRQDGDAASLPAWWDSAEDLRLAMQAREASVTRRLDEALDLLARAHRDRRVAAIHASAQATRAARAAFVPELWRELQVIPLLVQSRLRHLAVIVRAIPATATDITAIWMVLKRSFELILLFAAWFLARAWVPPALGRLLTRLGHAHHGQDPTARAVLEWLEAHGVPGDPTRLTDDLQGLARAGVSGLVAALLTVALRGAAPILSLLALLWLWRSLWAATPPLVRVLLAPPGAHRPALRTVQPTILSLTRRTVRTALAWGLGFHMLHVLAIDGLDADRLDDLVSVLATLSAWLIATALLWAWAPPIRQAVARGEQNRLTPYLTPVPSTRLLHPLQAAVGLTWLGAAYMSRLAGRLINQRAGLAWLGAAVARRRLRDAEAEEPTPTLPDAVLQDVQDGALAEPHLQSELEQLQAARQDWESDDHRGLIAVIGDRGAGKSALLATLEGGRVQHLRHPDRTGSPALVWLAEQLHLPPAPPEALIPAIEALPPSVFVVDDIHLLLLRTVGGFAPLRDVLDVMHATSNHHLWVLGFHGPTWSFLRGVPAAINLSVFRARVTLPPLDGEQLGAWLEAATRGAGLEPDYDRLVSDTLLGSDPARARERARGSFLRYLADASQGNRLTALTWWLDALHLGSTPERAELTMFRPPKAAALDALNDTDLFTLAALDIHDGLAIPQLAAALNAEPDACRATCRHLQTLGVLSHERGVYRIETRWQAGVDRLLRQRHFLYSRAEA